MKSRHTQGLEHAVFSWEKKLFVSTYYMPRIPTTLLAEHLSFIHSFTSMHIYMCTIIVNYLICKRQLRKFNKSGRIYIN